jgi:hypothetical protein
MHSFALKENFGLESFEKALRFGIDTEQPFLLVDQMNSKMNSKMKVL